MRSFRPVPRCRRGGAKPISPDPGAQDPRAYTPAQGGNRPTDALGRGPAGGAGRRVRASVADLPPEPQTLESGSKARVLEVKLDSGESVIIPRANVELIEG